jgi:hypothetical protein
MIQKPKTTEDYILLLLKGGPISTTNLLAKIQKSKSGLTKQGFYKTLRILIQEEVVVVRNKIVSLSHVWILKMSQFFENAKRSYSIETAGEDFLLLGDGEKVSYTFKSPEQTDMFWGHAFSVLVDTMKEDNVFLFNPHEWFLFARYDTERVLFDGVLKRNKKLFVLSGNNTPLDVFSKKDFDGDKSQYFTLDTNPFEKQNYYVNVFGDFLIEAWLDENVSQNIDAWYKKHTAATDEAIEELKQIVVQKGRNKFSISRNARKAEKIKSLFKKYFHVPKAG